MSELMPRITIVTPSFNQAKYLRATIESVLHQDYPNLEYFVIDGGSTDGSVEIIREYDNSIDWWTSEKDAGQSDAIRKGFDRASGVLIGWLNSDDLYFPNALNKVGEAYLRRPNASLYIGGLAIGEMGNGPIKRCTVPPPQWAWMPRYGQILVTQQSSFYSRYRYEQIGGIDLNMHMHMDGDLFYRLLRKNFSIVVINEILGFTRLHDETKSASSYGTRRGRVESELLRQSAGLSGWQKYFIPFLFRFARFISGSYTTTALQTLKFRGKNMSDIWFRTNSELPIR